MDRKYCAFLILIFFAAPFVCAEDSLPTEEILKRILERAKQNEELASGVGFQQVTTNKKIKDGKVSDQKVRTFRMIWIENKPYLELTAVNGKEPEDKEKKEEKERRVKFIKALREEPKEDPENITWDEMYAKYDFEPAPPDSTGRYIFTFKPKAGKHTQRSRMEKVLNHIQGKIWADEQFHIVKVEAKLLDNVRFGLGILGIIEKLELKYEQASFQKIGVPSYFFVHFKARIAVLKTEERKIESTFTDFFLRDSEQLSGL